MHLKYHDILRHASGRPLWWLDGVPRYEPFSPDVAGTFEIALVQTACQGCGTRYDVSVRPRPPLFHKLRNVLAYTNSLEVGDPPFACHELGATQCSAGYCTSSLEIKILEFWWRTGIRAEWQRDKRLERLLVDANGNGTGETEPPQPVFLRIHNSEKRDEWRQARERGDFSAMTKLLAEFGCERPADVANMVDLDRREQASMRERWALTEERLGKGE
jgi:hypothetical protein